MTKIVEEGSVRIDLLGGTLDLWPINLVIPGVITLNMAIDRRARVVWEKIDHPQIVIHSEDYQKDYTLGPREKDKFPEEMALVWELLSGMGVVSGVKLSLRSGSPPGAGLGGSSAMAIALVGAANKFLQLNWDQQKILQYTHNVEAKVLASGPAGYQDYYPALYGGILALHGEKEGVRVEQLLTSPDAPLKDYLQRHLTLVYSGRSRRSGVNNWEVYKGFFDGEAAIRDGLGEIAALSRQAYQAIRNGDYPQLLSLIARRGSAEGASFRELSPVR